jgi:cell division protein FtsX
LTRVRPVAALAALILAGCGASTTETTDTTPRATLVQATLREPSGCFVSVYVADEASDRQVARVRRILLGNTRVRTVAFVSKELALRRLAQIEPEFVRDLGNHNPLPARFEVVPLLRADVFGIISVFTQGVPGILNVRASTPCRHVPSLIPNG